VNDYYETVFAEMVADGSLSLQTVSFDNKPWHEIDTVVDLAKAERIFTADRYEITAPCDITLQTVGISRRISQRSRDREMDLGTISLQA